MKKKNSFVSSMDDAANVALTANGATTYASTMDACLDFFASGGAMRQWSANDVEVAFSKAFAENEETALRILFYLRDIRKGQGERKLFRTIFSWLAKNHPDFITKGFLYNVAEYGRWDDLLALWGTDLWSCATDVIAEQLGRDVDSNTPSLLAKWLPSENASEKLGIKIARDLAASMGMSSREYRKMLSGLRAKLKLVETEISSNKWGEIKYESVPSRANVVYRKAFSRHDATRYTAFIKAAQKGEVKINSSVLYPYDIAGQYIKLGVRCMSVDQTLEALWGALPNYCDGEYNALVVADTSGSMFSGTNSVSAPINVAVSLAIYFAERNKGVFANKWINFSTSPSWQTLSGKTLCEKIKNLDYSNWSGSTNLQAVFEMILEVGKKNKVPAADMPKKLIIVSDMQFNCVEGCDDNLTAIKKKYKAAKYPMPEVVFWNVNSAKNQPAKKNEKGVALVSGCSPSILTSLLGSKILSPIDTMNETIMSERYNAVAAAMPVR